jgi:hypothetical protein
MKPRRTELEFAGLVMVVTGGGAVFALSVVRAGPEVAPLVAIAVLLMAASLGYRIRGGWGRGARRALAMGALVLAVSLWLGRERPLTRLSSDELAIVLERDAALCRQTSDGIDAISRLLDKEGVPPEGDRVPLSAEQERILLDSWRALLDHAMVLDSLRHFYQEAYRFSLDKRAAHAVSSLMAIQADLALYLRASRFASRIARNANARKFLDTPHLEVGLGADSYSRFLDDVLGGRDQLRILAAQRYLPIVARLLPGGGAFGKIGRTLADRAREELASIARLSLLDRAEQSAVADFENLRRPAASLWYPVQKEVAELLGDTRVRRSHWYLIGEELRERVDAMAEPGDVLISRKNWYLSNIGLPGFWPHAILYLGDSAKLARRFDGDAAVIAWLRSRGVESPFSAWLAERHPKAWASYSSPGSHGERRRVIEAVSEGVVMSTLYDCAGDYLAVLRPKLPALAKAQAIAAAFEHWGKPYDFDFDFATDHAVVCTELVWRAYRAAPGKDGLDMPLVSVAGRMTLPANEIAAQYAREHGTAKAQLELVAFVDAREKSREAYLSSEEAFRATHARTKWDIAQR